MPTTTITIEQIRSPEQTDRICIGRPPFPKRKLAGKIARFRLVDMEKPHTHHRALKFPDGQVIRVTRLRERQHLPVLQLPAASLGKRKSSQTSI
jgi:hypothetical protein